MIRVQSITIKDFRGIRDLTLSCNGKSFAICGPNGTGKSGVVDALEFALTGSVSRLTGEGRGEVSLIKHGPHVDRRNDPSKARVTVVLTIPSLNKTVTVERCVKTASIPQITPNEPAIREVLDQVSAHPEFVLSRRELIRYVLATPGKRAEEVGALLHLDQVRCIRAGFTKIANACEKRLETTRASLKLAGGNLALALDVSELTKDAVLTTANVQRAILGLAPLTELTASTSLKDGMATPTKVVPQRIPKHQARADLTSLRESIAALSDPTVTVCVTDIISDIATLAGDPAAIDALKREGLYSSGLGLIEAQACPLCDLPWDPEALKTHLQAKLAHLKDVSTKRKAIEAAIKPLRERMQILQLELGKFVTYSKLAVPPTPSVTAEEYRHKCETIDIQLAALLPFAGTTSVLSTLTQVPAPLSGELDSLEQAITALPDPTKLDAARDWLAVAQERLEAWKNAKREHKTTSDRAERSRHISDVFTRTSDEVLTGLYNSVQDEFAKLYAFMNQHDESRFKAELVPSLGKLGFDVDFYGRGMFPPGAYHSEGHQDGMGLCLYLALMRQTLGPGFTFAVLDDVLMSVDAEHRRAVCALLKRHFPDTQFVVTTHDPIWLRHMRTEGIIGSGAFAQFRDWNVDHGPTRWDGRAVWTEIDEYVRLNDVRGGSALLRHYLEYTAKELCHRLRAPVEFHGDAQYTLGDLLPAAIGRLMGLYRRAKEAANSWNHRDVLTELKARESAFSLLVSSSNAEQWQVNVAVHFNSWDNLGREDFEPVVQSFRNLLAGFSCAECGEYLRISPDHGTTDTLRCDCGKVSINLKKSPATVEKPNVPALDGASES